MSLYGVVLSNKIILVLTFQNNYPVNDLLTAWRLMIETANSSLVISKDKNINVTNSSNNRWAERVKYLLESPNIPPKDTRKYNPENDDFLNEFNEIVPKESLELFRLYYQANIDRLADWDERNKVSCSKDKAGDSPSLTQQQTFLHDLVDVSREVLQVSHKD